MCQNRPSCKLCVLLLLLLLCQSILHPLDESVPVYSCHVIPNTALEKNVSYLFCSFQQTNSTAVHKADFSRNTNWPPHLQKAPFKDKGDNCFYAGHWQRSFSGPPNYIKGVKFVIGYSSVTFLSHELLHCDSYSHIFCQPTVQYIST